MPQINVFVLKTTFGQDKDVNLNYVQEVKSLLEKVVYVQLEEIGMEPVVYNVLMVKFGKIFKNNVFVLTDINGMDNFVIGHIIVLETESGMKILNNVYVLQHNIGVEDNVQLSQFVVVVDYGILKLSNVNVNLDINGIHKIVLYVLMVKFGINLH